jgi:DNA-binding LacI/PurR family transcriptional regulator
VATSRDVAKHAGVSQATVSAVINNSKRVNPVLRARVERAIRFLNYQPHSAARSLRGGRNYLVAVQVPTILSPAYPPAVKAIEDVLSRKGFNVMLLDANEDPEHERRNLELLTRARVDGAIVAPTGPGNEHLLLQISSAGLPVVIFSAIPGSLLLDSVAADDRSGTYVATRHLLSLGRRRVALLSRKLLAPPDLDRYEGYKDALREFGLPVHPELVRIGPFSVDDGFNRTSEFLDLKDRPDGLVICNQTMTFGALACLRARNVRVPEELSLVTHDDMPWSALISPGLTSVHQPFGDMGARAAEILLQRLEGSTSSPQRIVLPSQLVIRESCGWFRRAREGDRPRIPPVGMVSS